MQPAPAPAEFPIDLLSVREREVLDLAVAGHTDEQIGQALEITTSTVNSYWVRIRGKLGQFSRTEIVGHVLRHESNLRYADLIAENERLRTSDAQARHDLAEVRRDLTAMRGAAWHLLALDHMPDAAFVCRPPGEIVYANLRAEHLYAAKPGELTALMTWDLTIPEDKETRRHAASAFFDPQRLPRVVIGVERPYYGHRRDGTNFRAILIAERFVSPEGPMAVLTVREYLEDVDVLIRHLRKPFEVD